VADSQREKKQENIDSFKDMVENLVDFGEDINNVPIILQYNKRDLFDILTIEELQAEFKP